MTRRWAFSLYQGQAWWCGRCGLGGEGSIPPEHLHPEVKR